MKNLITNLFENLTHVVSKINLSTVDILAQDTTSTSTLAELSAKVEMSILTTNNIWMMICTAMVFIMHLGFATVETGFCQSKNTVNVLFKNTLTPMIGILLFWACGFNLMYPGFAKDSSGIFGFAGFGIASLGEINPLTYAGGNYTYWTDFLFQAMFAATCATIVSGAVAERIKIEAYLPFTLLFVGLVYPILGSWKWGLGWLDAKGFYDFAGSTVVHSVGGWAALAGIWIVGARIGKYKDGKVNDFPGASVPLSVIGVFLLWFGWFGFNGGSVLSADPEMVSYVLVTTCLSACTGGLAGVFTGSFVFKRLDLGMALNGILAGLVAITASANVVSIGSALIIGAVAGVLVVFSATTFDKLKLDDCVGATSVHLVCGIWGTLAVGLFGIPELMGTTTDGVQYGTFSAQLIGVVAYALGAFPAAAIIFLALKYTIGVRVKEENEINGLDSHEHGIRGYTILVP